MNNRLHRLKLALLIIFTVSITSACKEGIIVEKNVIEDIAPVIFWSIEKGQEKNYKVSTIMPPMVNEKKRFMSVETDLLTAAARNFNLNYYRELKTGQLRILFISEELAEEGLLPIINSLLKNPETSRRLFIVVLRGSLDNYVTAQLDKQEDLDYYLYSMMKHYENQGKMTLINTQAFIKLYYENYSDPYLPVFHVDEDRFEYTGTGFVKGDKIVLKSNNQEDQIYQNIANDYFLRYYSIEDLSLVIGQARSEVDMTIDNEMNTLKLSVDLSGDIEEYKGKHDFYTRSGYEDLTKELKEYLEDRTEKLLKKMQKKEIDPLSVGKLTLKPFTKPLSRKQWIDIWVNMDIEVEYNIHLEPLNELQSKDTEQPS